MANKFDIKGYEENIVSVKGIVIFGIGLVALIVVSFWLMYVLESYMEEQAAATKDQVNPVRQAILEKNPEAFLPPEPRLQAAPGHGIDAPTGRISLELKPPQSEWRELKRIWDEELAKGQIDSRTGAVITLPIEKAKEKVVEEGLIKAKQDQRSKEEYENSKRIISYSSGGRLANEIRR